MPRGDCQRHILTVLSITLGHKVVLNWINKYAGLPPHTIQFPDDEQFWGGVKSENETDAQAEMMTQGKPEM